MAACPRGRGLINLFNPLDVRGLLETSLVPSPFSPPIVKRVWSTGGVVGGGCAYRGGGAGGGRGGWADGPGGCGGGMTEVGGSRCRC